MEKSTELLSLQTDEMKIFFFLFLSASKWKSLSQFSHDENVDSSQVAEC